MNKQVAELVMLFAAEPVGTHLTLFNTDGGPVEYTVLRKVRINWWQNVETQQPVEVEGMADSLLRYDFVWALS